MLVLGIESTCDETACAIVRDGNEILSNIISSQIDLHSTYGGVVPELACRRHIDVIIPVIDEAVKKAGIELKDIDLIAVAHGPGLIGALLIGLNAAKALALALKKPFVGINHVEAHLYAVLMSHCQVTFPCIGVVVSGGHTALLQIKEIGHYSLIGHTVDDAAGEAFDKVAKLMNLPYPGGPEIERLALNGNAKRFAIKAGKIKTNPFDFSFSGTKTAVLYTVRDLISKAAFSEQDKCDLAASFQAAVLQDIVNKSLLAAQEYGCETIIVGGGVSNNRYLRELFKDLAPKHQIFWPPTGLTMDNAAMIAGLGYHYYLKRGQGDAYDLEALTRMPFLS